MNTKLLKESVIKAVFFAAALSSIIIVFYIIGEVAYVGWPQVSSWVTNGFGMKWQPSAIEGQGVYGIIPYMFSTTYAGVGAILIGALIGLPCAIYLAEFSNEKLRNIVKPALEMLTGFPSVVIGLVGFTLLCATLYKYLGPPGTTMLAAWLVLGIMSLPTIASISEDALRAVPQDQREAALGLGATKWQTTTRVLLPGAKSGIAAALLLALGSAMGETMAVIMVVGAIQNPPITLNPYVNSGVFTGIINAGANPDNPTLQYKQAIYAAGLILFVIVAMLNLVTRRVLSGTKISGISRSPKP